MKKICDSLLSLSKIGYSPQRCQQILHKPCYSFFFGKAKPQEAPKQEKKKVLDYSQEDIDSWSDISYLLKNMKDKNKELPPLIPEKDVKDSDKLTVVLEMDETLLYVFYPDEHEAYMSAPLSQDHTFINYSDHDYYVDYPEYDTYLSIYKRPHLDEFLQYLRNNTEPILFCAGVRSYVEKVLNIVDPHKTFKHIICQEGCNKITLKEENIDDYLKDLNRLNRDLSRTVYIDSHAFSFWSNPDNSIPILEYLADSTLKDTALLTLMSQLEELKQAADVRQQLIEKFGIREALEDSKMI